MTWLTAEVPSADPRAWSPPEDHPQAFECCCGAHVGDDVTERAHKLLSAGIQTREGERNHESIANNV